MEPFVFTNPHFFNLDSMSRNNNNNNNNNRSREATIEDIFHVMKFKKDDVEEEEEEEKPKKEANVIEIECDSESESESRTQVDERKEQKQWNKDSHGENSDVNVQSNKLNHIFHDIDARKDFCKSSKKDQNGGGGGGEKSVLESKKKIKKKKEEEEEKKKDKKKKKKGKKNRDRDETVTKKEDNGKKKNKNKRNRSSSFLDDDNNKDGDDDDDDGGNGDGQPAAKKKKYKILKDEKKYDFSPLHQHRTTKPVLFDIIRNCHFPPFTKHGEKAISTLNSLTKNEIIEELEKWMLSDECNLSEKEFLIAIQEARHLHKKNDKVNKRKDYEPNTAKSAAAAEALMDQKESEKRAWFSAKEAKKGSEMMKSFERTFFIPEHLGQFCRIVARENTHDDNFEEFATVISFRRVTTRVTDSNTGDLHSDGAPAMIMETCSRILPVTRYASFIILEVYASPSFSYSPLPSSSSSASSSLSSVSSSSSSFTTLHNANIAEQNFPQFQKVPAVGDDAFSSRGMERGTSDRHSITFSLPENIRKVLFHARSEEVMAMERQALFAKPSVESLRLYISEYPAGRPPSQSVDFSDSECPAWERDNACRFRCGDDPEILFKFEPHASSQGCYVRLPPPLTVADSITNVTFTFPGSVLRDMFQSRNGSSILLYVGLEHIRERECALLVQPPSLEIQTPLLPHHSFSTFAPNGTAKAMIAAATTTTSAATGSLVGEKTASCDNTSVFLATLYHQERQFYESVAKIFDVVNNGSTGGSSGSNISNHNNNNNKESIGDFLESGINRDYDNAWVDISLLDRSTFNQLRYPGRGIDCSHLNAFDLSNFILDNEMARPASQAWRCPLCDRSVKPTQLIRDLFVEKIVRCAPKSRSKIFRIHNPLFRKCFGGGAGGSGYYTEYL